MIFESRCAGCDRPGATICTTCRFALVGARVAPTADGVISAVPFAGRARDVLLGLKYRNRRAVGGHLAGLVVNRLVESGVAGDVDVVTWAPTSAKRRRERGYDQAELIARVVGRQLGVPVKRLLDRRDDVRQTGRSRHERLDGPAFAARPGVDGLRVVVIDDVVTTGATLRRAAAALRQRRADVVCAAVAATPVPAVAAPIVAAA
ncbi:MAG: phosphoribosyltransferase family protein [Actinomycetota bacterium]